MDSETLALLHRLAADEAGLPETAHRWVHGETISEARADARRFAESVGLGQPRDHRGRFSSGSQAMNDEIRRRAGYPPSTPPERPIGNLGIGVGGSARESPRPQPNMTALIRAAHAGRRSVAHQFAEQIAMEEAS